MKAMFTPFFRISCGLEMFGRCAFSAMKALAEQSEF